MGHTRIGTLPDTHRWRAVVGLLSDEEADAGAVASATMNAAERGLRLAATDEGLRHAIWLLSHLTLAAREQDFKAALNGLGLRVRQEPSVFSIVGAFSDAMDRHLRTTASRTDIGEMAQMAAAETLAQLCTRESQTLFGPTPESVQSAVRGFSTRNGFAALAHEFFSRLTNKYLTYHLSREISNHVGPNKRFRDPREHSQFLANLDTHCRQAALIVRDFAGGWHSKANYEDGISPIKARNFAWAAMKKLRAELKIRGARDAE